VIGFFTKILMDDRSFLNIQYFACEKDNVVVL
jgi:hypothetical protein